MAATFSVLFLGPTEQLYNIGTANIARGAHTGVKGVPVALLLAFISMLITLLSAGTVSCSQQVTL